MPAAVEAVRRMPHNEEELPLLLPPEGSDIVECLEFYCNPQEDAPWKDNQKVQRYVSRMIFDAQFRTLLAAQPPALKARLLSASRPNTSLWLTSALSFGAQRIPNLHFQIMVRLRLLLPPADNMPDFCGECETRLTGDGGDHLHHLNCPRTLRSYWHVRHNALRDHLATCVHQVGGLAAIEPCHLAEDQRRPDLWTILGEESRLVDVSVRCPSARSNIENHQGLRPGGVILAAERQKHRRYNEMARANGASLVPFVMEDTGGFGKEALKYVQEIGVYANST